MGNQVLEMAGAQDGMAFLQLADAGIEEGFAAGSQQVFSGLMHFEAGPGSQDLQRGVCLDLGGHKGHQRAAVVQGYGHSVAAQRTEILYKGWISGREDSFQEAGGIGQDGGGLCGAVE